jgi:hypothetical protein
MKFSTRQDTDLPADALFAAVSDFPRMERILLRRGASLRRLDGQVEPGPGLAWQIGFDWRGKARELQLKVTSWQPPERLGFSGMSELFNIVLTATVVALSPGKSRLIFEAEVQPRGMKARLMLQTARLGKTQLEQKFALAVGDFIQKLAADAA